MADAQQQPTGQAQFKAYAMSFGLTDEDVAYIVGKGIVNAALLSRAYPELELWETKVVDPYVRQTAEKGDEREPELIQAVFRILHEESVLLRNNDVAVRSNVDKGQGIADAGATRAPGGTQTQAVPQKRKANELEPGDWQKGIDAWEASSGKKFNRKLLLGSEMTLARMKFEQAVTREYTPVGLVEIWQQRTFLIDGSANMQRVKMTKEDVEALATSDDGNRRGSLGLKDPLAVQDAIMAIMWAMRWAGYSSDEGSLAWADALGMHFRNNKLRGRNFADFFWSYQWRICLRMREGATFDEASVEVEADREALKAIIEDIHEKNNVYRNKDRNEAEAIISESAQSKARPQGHASSDFETRRGQQKRRPDHHPIGGPSPPPQPRGRQLERQPDDRQRGGRDARMRSKTPGGRKICRAWNNNACKKLGLGAHNPNNVRTCIFRHVCRVPGCNNPRCGGEKTHGRK
jgi:hypothetical protein